MELYTTSGLLRGSSVLSARSRLLLCPRTTSPPAHASVDREPSGAAGAYAQCGRRHERPVLACRLRPHGSTSMRHWLALPLVVWQLFSSKNRRGSDKTRRIERRRPRTSLQVPSSNRVAGCTPTSPSAPSHSTRTLTVTHHHPHPHRHPHPHPTHTLTITLTVTPTLTPSPSPLTS